VEIVEAPQEDQGGDLLDGFERGWKCPTAQKAFQRESI
jgi:hypothetical protein